MSCKGCAKRRTALKRVFKRKKEAHDARMATIKFNHGDVVSKVKTAKPETQENR